MAAPDFGQLLGFDEGGLIAAHSVTLDTAHAGGRPMVLVMAINNPARSLTGVSDSGGNVWTVLARTQAGAAVEIFIAVSNGAISLPVGGTVTAAFDGATSYVGVLFECVNMLTTESAGANATGTDATPTATVVRTLTQSLTVGAVASASVLPLGVVTEDADYTEIKDMQHSVALTNLSLHVGYRDRSTTGDDTYNPTLDGVAEWVEIISDFGPSTTGLDSTTGIGAGVSGRQRTVKGWGL